MKGSPTIDPLVPGTSTEFDWKTINALIKNDAREVLIKLPAGADLTAEVLGSSENWMIDLSKLGVIVTGFTNGAPTQGIALYAQKPFQVT